MPRSSATRRALLRPPDRPARGDVGALVDACSTRRRASSVEEQARGHADVAEHRHRDRVEAAERIGSQSTCTIGLYDAMPVWFENDAPNTSSRSDSFMSQLTRPACRCGRARRTPSGWSSGTMPLALNVVSDRRVERSASATTSSMLEARAVPDHDHRPLRAGDERERLARPRRRAARSRGRRTRPLGPPTLARRRRGQHLHLVGQHEVRDAALRRARACSARLISSAWSESRSTVCE